MRATSRDGRGVKTFNSPITVGSTQLTEAEIGLLDGVTAGTTTASKAVVAGTNKNSDVRPTVTTHSANGAITIRHGTHKITKAGIAVMTLAAPAAGDEGIRMLITSQTANAHTVTAASGFNGDAAGADVATFGGAIGDCFEVVAINLLWHVISLHNVTLG